MDIKPDEIIKTNRKSIGLEIAFDGRLIVRAPRFVSLKTIQNVLEKKQRWIASKQETMRQKHAQIASRKFVPGEKFWFLGKLYDFEIVDDIDEPIIFEDRFKILEKYSDRAKGLFFAWYKVKAEEIILPRVELYASIAGVKYERVRISSAKTRWGSCGARKNINLSWRLILTPLEVVDYIVVHELMHIKQHNHGPKFWREVEKIMPNYEICEKWLRENAHLLYFE